MHKKNTQHGPLSAVNDTQSPGHALKAYFSSRPGLGLGLGQSVCVRALTAGGAVTLVEFKRERER